MRDLQVEKHADRGTRTVPFLDLSAVHDELKDEFLRDIAELIDTGAFTNGPAVRAFELAYADYCGTLDCVGLANGLDALRLTLLAAGIEAGDEVIVPANTFAATFEAVAQAGGRPLPVDVTHADWNLDVDAAGAAVSERTRFVMPVHLYGQMADMRAIDDLARRCGLKVIEDAAQAHGASRDGIRAGSAGLGGAFSFYPAKNLGAFGDAGALTTSDAALADRLRALREHGQRAKYRHELEGYTARLDTLQALVLLRKLPLLDAWNEQRRAIAASYLEQLEGVGDLGLPQVPSGSEPVWHLFVVTTADPVGLAEFLASRGIGTGRHYPEPAHLSPAYAWLGYALGAFPISEALCERALSLPVFPGMTADQVEVVTDATRAFFTDG